MAEENVKQQDSTEQTNAPNPNLRTYHGIKYDITDPKFQGLSRNAIKKLLKEELWNATREQRNKYQKEKHKRKRAERRQLIEQGVIPPPPPKRPRSEDVVPSPVRVVIDCSFSSYMTEKEIHSLQAQLVRCYSANRSTLHPMNITVTSLDEPLKKTFETKTSSYINWKNIEFTSESYMDKFDEDSLIYLSADSDNIVDELEDDKVYIIGGIVDKNRHKGLCQEKATKQGIKTARLPIGDYLAMASRQVLTTNHVYEIMIKWLEHRDWEKAFAAVIPQRKLKGSKWIKDGEDEESTKQQGSETEAEDREHQVQEERSDEKKEDQEISSKETTEENNKESSV